MTTITHDELRERARMAVARSGLTQTQVAARMGIPQPHISEALSPGSTQRRGVLLAILRTLSGGVEDWRPITVYAPVEHAP